MSSFNTLRYCVDGKGRGHARAVNHLHGSSTLTGWDGMGSPSRRTQREIPLISYLCSSQTLAASSSSSAFQEQISRSETIDWIHRAHTHTASPFIPFHVARSLVLRDPLVKCLGLMQAYAPRPRASPGILGLRCSDHQLCDPIAPGSLH